MTYVLKLEEEIKVVILAKLYIQTMIILYRQDNKTEILGKESMKVINNFK